MTDISSLPVADFSPDVDSIPQECTLERLDERRYLIGGQLREWNGPMHSTGPSGARRIWA